MVNAHTVAIMAMTMQIPGILSCVSAAFIILSYALFKDLQNLRFIQLVFYVALNDFIASIGVALGYQPSGSIACWFQGLVTNAIFLSSSLWTVVIAYQLWLAVKKGQIIKDMTYIHCFCWGFPWLVTLLPLITSTYGLQDDEYDSWCFVMSTSHSPSWSLTFWFWLSFYAWIFFSIIIMVILLLDVACTVQYGGATSDMVTSAVKKLAYYPVIIFVCWIPSAISDFFISGGDENANNALVINSIGNVFPACQGILAGIVFFTQNPIVRKNWAKLLCCSWCGRFLQPTAGGTPEFGRESENDITRQSDYISTIEHTLDRRTTFGTAPAFVIRESGVSLFSIRKSVRMSTCDEFREP